MHAAPEQVPSNPANFESASAAADRVTAVSTGKIVPQVPGQSMPAGLEVTRPTPLPAVTTVTLNVGISANAAETDAGAVRRSEHDGPVHPPEKPANVEPTVAEAVKVTAVPGAKMAEHTPGQSMAAGVETTEPPPVTCSASSTGLRMKVATAAASAASVMVQAGPAQAPPKPVKPQPAAADG